MMRTNYAWVNNFSLLCFFIYREVKCCKCYFLETQKWSKTELGGPPPACRLDFGVCKVRMRVSIRTPDDTEDIAASSLQAKEVIGSQVR